MRMSIFSHSFFLLILATLVSITGCVSRGSYKDVVQENTALKSSNLELNDELALVSLDVAQLELEQAELIDDVKKWAVLGAIEMELMADGLHVILPHDVLFSSGTSTLSTEGRQLIAEFSHELKSHPYQIFVIGFTDNTPIGPNLLQQYPSNWELAGARAASVVRVMVEEGLPADQLIAASRGEMNPVASNDTDEGRSKNRRIDIRIRPVKK
ncbi:hypothetical protein A9Q88_08380 [Gammaproteobacteria bacterium 50_400_T64]|nr:hypothetical protein A9Q88_08380 [Gammaproteobacteria bacterium 50_400_T64]